MRVFGGTSPFKEFSWWVIPPSPTAAVARCEKMRWWRRIPPPAEGIIERRSERKGRRKVRSRPFHLSSITVRFFFGAVYLLPPSPPFSAILPLSTFFHICACAGIRQGVGRTELRAAGWRIWALPHGPNPFKNTNVFA